MRNIRGGPSSPLRGRPPLQREIVADSFGGAWTLHRPSGGDLHCSRPSGGGRPMDALLHRPSGGDLHCSLRPRRSAASACGIFIAPPGATSIAAWSSWAACLRYGTTSSPLRGRPPLQRYRTLGGTSLPCPFIAPPGATSIAACDCWDAVLDSIVDFIAPPGATSIAARSRGAMILGDRRRFIAPPGATSIAARCSCCRPPRPYSLLHRPSGGDLHCSTIAASGDLPVPLASSPLRGRPPLQRRPDPRRHQRNGGFIAPPGATSIAA